MIMRQHFYEKINFSSDHNLYGPSLGQTIFTADSGRVESTIVPEFASCSYIKLNGSLFPSWCHTHSIWDYNIFYYPEKDVSGFSRNWWQIMAFWYLYK
jgi:hypothetical protein